MDVSSNASASYPLSDVEKIIWRLSEAAPLNVTMVARIRGPLSSTDLQHALNVLQSQHELLQVRVEKTKGGLAYRSHGVPEIPLHETAAERDAWVPLVEDEINRPLLSHVGPLARCVHVRHAADQHHLLLTFHHVVGDGMSGVFLVRDLLTAATDSPRVAATNPEGFRPPTAMDRRLPAYTRGWRGWKLGLAFQTDSSLADIRFRPPQRTRLDQFAPPDARTIRIIAREFNPEITDQIIQRSRQEGTTVHAALAAAMCLAVVDDINHTAPVSVKFRTPVNVRQDLVPPAGEDLGLFASMAFFRDRVTSRDDFWQLARRVRAQITNQVQRGIPCMLVRLMPILYRLIRADRLTDQEFTHRWYDVTPSTCGITNIGRLGIATEYGALQLDALHFAVAMSALGDFSCTVSSLGGRLHCNFLCPQPVISTGHAQELVGDIETRLLKAIA